MKTKASIVVMSHLSDATAMESENAKLHIEFAKWIILKTKGNLTQEIDSDVMYNEFLKIMKHLLLT